MTSNILEQIIANKKMELSSRKRILSINYFKKHITLSTRSLFAALNHKKASFIFECKKASPSKGLLTKDFDLANILSVYKDYASAISVLTDQQYFQGSFDYLTQASQTVDQPILCKDFFIEPYQIYEARHFGADAILLMLSVLSDKAYVQLATLAEQLKLDVLTEVHNNIEMQRALALNAKIIGINNRNLKDLSVDLATTENLIHKLPREIDKSILFVSESGIDNHQQVKRLAPLVQGFLVGSSIISKTNIRLQCKKLIYGNNKICGLTTPEAAIAAFENGATYGGLIFYDKSPRYVNSEQAKKIMLSAALNYVGVFVNETLFSLINRANELGLKIIQLHGSENDQYINQLKQQLPQCEIWKAVSVKAKTIKEQNIKMDHPMVDRYLLDTFNRQLAGGSGKTFNWDLLNSLNKDKVILAGGINIKNIRKASKLNTYALDINSGVEEQLGLKSIKKIKAIFQQLHA